jgi:hypothetical protein
MGQQSLQALGGALTGASLTALDANFDELYGFYGIASGNPFATNRFVDGDHGSDTNDGLTPSKAFATIQAAINASGQGDRIFIKPLEGDSASGDTDPDSYAETLTITGKDGLQLIGCGRGCTHGGQPQIKKGSGSTALCAINSFGVGLHGLTFNGAGATGGGVTLVYDGSTKDAGGTVIRNCYFKNCKGSAAAATGGGVYWSANGGCWHVVIENCSFYDCRAGIALLGTALSVPRGVKILNCLFFAAANTTVDADIYAAGSGFSALVIDGCKFNTIDVPAYASSPDAARYMELLGSGVISNCTFACVTDPAGTEITFGAAGTGATFPTTFRMANCYGEGVVATADQSLIGRT